MNSLTVIRGGGDLATGVIYRLWRMGMPMIVLELANPLVVRRRVAVATAVLEGSVTVERMTAQRVATWAEVNLLWQQGIVPVMVAAELPHFPQPIGILVDGRMAKRNIDTHIAQAPLVIALGPGFVAGMDCHAVIETQRGHCLGRVIWQGAALPNTGTPGIVAGKGAERVLRAGCAGIVHWQVEIGQQVTNGQQLGTVAELPVVAPFDGVVRGLIAPGCYVPAHLKIGDIDPRADREACFTISDKALAIGGGVVEAIFSHRWQPKEALPTLSLPAALQIGQSPELVAFTGGGGKTSLMLTLGQALGTGVVMGTTTHIAQKELTQVPALCPIENLSALPDQLRRWGRCLLVGEMAGEKVKGMSPEMPAQLLTYPAVNYVLVEADGSRQLPLKAPAAHEPVIPPEATLVVPVVGMNSLGLPIAHVTHRPELMAKIVGLGIEEQVTPELVAKLLTHEEGGLKRVPAHARLIPFLNQAETAEQLIQARHIAQLSLRHPRLTQVVIGAVQTCQPVREIIRRVRAVVLAAGQSQRMGQPKQLLNWGETTILGQTLRHLSASYLYDGVVITGYQAEAVAQIAAAHNVPSLFNPHYASGEMLSSLQLAIQTIEPHISAVLVVLADQPMITSATFDALLIAYWQGHGKLIAPTFQGKRGNPVLIDRAYFAELLALPAGSAPRELLKRHESELYLLELTTDTILRDLDSPEEYTRWRPKLGQVN